MISPEQKFVITVFRLLLNKRFDTQTFVPYSKRNMDAADKLINWSTDSKVRIEHYLAYAVNKYFKRVNPIFFNQMLSKKAMDYYLKDGISNGHVDVIDKDTDYKVSKIANEFDGDEKELKQFLEDIDF